MATDILYLKRGDYGLTYSYTCTEKSGAVPPFATATAIKFVLRRLDTGEVFRRDGAVTDLVTGQLSYQLALGDTEMGDLLAEWEVTYPGRVQTYPERGYLEIKIDADLR